MNQLNISKTIMNKRREKGVTQEEIAIFLGVSKASVSKWETGQSYPDITLLPQLAGYFNITIDELVNYQSQMTREEIRKIYGKLALDFTEEPFDQVMGEIRNMVKEYFSCFPLIFQLGALIINHYNLEEEAKRPLRIREAMALFVRIKSECEDVTLCKQAIFMEATCWLLLSEPDKIVALLDSTNTPVLNESNLLSVGYSMTNQPEKANEILQVGIYQNMLSLLQNMLSLLQLEVANVDKVKEIVDRISAITHSFQVEELHPAIMFSVYLTEAGVFSMIKNRESTLLALEKYCNLAVRDIYPITLHGDTFFDHIEGWISELDLGVQAPRSDKTIKHSIVESVTKNPAFGFLADDIKYKKIIRKLAKVLGG